MELNSANWRKSTYSGGNGASCVEVGNSASEIVVRDTTNRAGAVLAIPAEAWQALLAAVRAS